MVFMLFAKCFLTLCQVLYNCSMFRYFEIISFSIIFMLCVLPDDVDEDLSGLTQGGVICGNPSKALRSRRRNKPSTLRTNPKLLEHVSEKYTEIYFVIAGKKQHRSISPHFIKSCDQNNINNHPVIASGKKKKHSH